MENYRQCFVPTCKNDSENSSKTIVRIREDLREKWCREVNVEYFKVYTQYCCEDHFDPKQDLTNFYYKSENQEPRFKPTATLRNIGVHIMEELSSGSQPDGSESVLAKLLLQSEPESKKRKFEEINMPSTSYSPSKLPNGINNDMGCHVGSETGDAMKTDCIPSKLKCQPDSKKRASTPPPYGLRKRTMKTMASKNRVNCEAESTAKSVPEDTPPIKALEHSSENSELLTADKCLEQQGKTKTNGESVRELRPAQVVIKKHNIFRNKAVNADSSTNKTISPSYTPSETGPVQSFPTNENEEALEILQITVPEDTPTSTILLQYPSGCSDLHIAGNDMEQQENAITTGETDSSIKMIISPSYTSSETGSVQSFPSKDNENEEEIRVILITVPGDTPTSTILLQYPNGCSDLHIAGNDMEQQECAKTTGETDSSINMTISPSYTPSEIGPLQSFPTKENENEEVLGILQITIPEDTSTSKNDNEEELGILEITVPEDTPTSKNDNEEVLGILQITVPEDTSTSKNDNEEELGILQITVPEDTPTSKNDNEEVLGILQITVPEDTSTSKNDNEEELGILQITVPEDTPTSKNDNEEVLGILQITVPEDTSTSKNDNEEVLGILQITVPEDTSTSKNDNEEELGILQIMVPEDTPTSKNDNEEVLGILQITVPEDTSTSKNDNEEELGIVQIMVPEDTPTSKILLQYPSGCSDFQTSDIEQQEREKTTGKSVRPLQDHIKKHIPRRKAVKTDSNMNKIISPSYPPSETASVQSLPTKEKKNKEAFRILWILQMTIKKIIRKSQFYTGLPVSCCHLLNLIGDEIKIPEHHLLMCLKKIRLDSEFHELADDFTMNESYASKMFQTNLPLIASVLRPFIVQQDLRITRQTLPTAFRHKYSNVACILDFLEIKVRKASNTVNLDTWPEKVDTVKYLISCTPNGLISYASPGYRGEISETSIVQCCGFLNTLSEGMSVLINRGFENIERCVLMPGVSFVRPPSLRAGTGLAESRAKQNIANLRKPIGSIMSRLREFSMLKPHKCLDTNMINVIDEVVIIACAFVNLQ